MRADHQGHISTNNRLKEEVISVISRGHWFILETKNSQVSSAPGTLSLFLKHNAKSTPAGGFERFLQFYGLVELLAENNIYF